MMDVYIQEGFWVDTWLWKETGIKAWKVSEAAEIKVMKLGLLRCIKASVAGQDLTGSK